ncbi:MAG TPA: vitamin K epoxide reductase family protein [Gaiellaceae bacterium]|nr:vitamin K epoxide reductase family protein [Gaiellaceae bacterium]
MTERPFRIAVGVLALAGIGVAGYLAYARFADKAISCATGGCETVQSSAYADVLGIPVAVIGVAGYLALLATALSAGETARLTGAALALAALVFSAYLLLVQIFAIGAFCQWCLVNDVIVALLAVAAVARLAVPLPRRGAAHRAASDTVV